MPKSVFLIFLSISLCVSTSALRADEKSDRVAAADAHLVLAKRFYETGEYARAIDEALAGQAIEIRADFSYLLGQSERMRGDCIKAIAHYQSALAIAQTHAQKGLIRIQIDRCERDSKNGNPPPTVPGTPVVVAPSPPPSPPPGPAEVEESKPIPAPKRGWGRDVAGGVLTGLGVGAVAAGAGLWGWSAPIVSARAIDTQHYEDARAAQVPYIAGIVLVGAGAVAVAAGIARYIIVAKRR